MFEKKVIDTILSKITQGSLHLTLWDGTEKVYGHGAPEARVVIKDPKVVRAMMKNVSLATGEAYAAETLEITGPLDDFFHVFFENQKNFGKLLTNQVGYRRQTNNKDAQKSYIAHHYDVGNDFYKMWLDNETMAYTCAYFRTEKDSLETAQTQKFDHVLRKVQLQKGQHVLDIGCGWGHLLVRAAKKYGATGLGVTLSEEQCKYATELAKKEGVADKVKFELINYQDLYDCDVKYDRIWSVGIMEHVGKGNLHEYFRVVDKLLVDKGVGFVHTISQQEEIITDAWIDKYIFPGGYLPSVRELIGELPSHNFRLIDYENIRLHYSMTLNEWLKRFEAHEKEITEMFDKAFYLTWRYWLAASSASFRYGPTDLSQMVFSKGINNDLPLTREHIYPSSK